MNDRRIKANCSCGNEFFVEPDDLTVERIGKSADFYGTRRLAYCKRCGNEVVVKGGQS